MRMAFERAAAGSEWNTDEQAKTSDAEHDLRAQPFSRRSRPDPRCRWRPDGQHLAVQCVLRTLSVQHAVSDTQLPASRERNLPAAVGDLPDADDAHHQGLVCLMQ